MSRKATYILVVIAAVLVAVTALVPRLPYMAVLIHETSMEPHYKPGGAVIIHRGRPVFGQPIAFTHKNAKGEDELVVHRYIADNGDGTITTLGDKNPGPDTWCVPKNDIIGGAAWYVPHLGAVLYTFDIGCPFHFPTGEVIVLLVVVVGFLLRWALKKPRRGPPVVNAAHRHL